MKTPLETRGRDSHISLLPKYWDTVQMFNQSKAAQPFPTPIKLCWFPISLFSGPCKNKNPAEQNPTDATKKIQTLKSHRWKKIKDTSKSCGGYLTLPAAWILNSLCNIWHYLKIDLSKKFEMGTFPAFLRGWWRVHLKSFLSGKTCRPVHPTVTLCLRKSHPEPQKGTKATFPWAHPVLPPATAPKTSLKPPHKVTLSCGDTRNSPPGHVCVTALLSQRMTPLIAALLKSFDICGKNILFQPQQPSALPGFQQVLNCCLSPALLLLTEDHTEFCPLWNPCSYTLANSSEWSWHRNDSKARESWGKCSETTLRFVAALVRRGRSHPRAAESQIPCLDALGWAPWPWDFSEQLGATWRLWVCCLWHWFGC